jgi:nucleotide-binding universal stress UspA family protein
LEDFMNDTRAPLGALVVAVDTSADGARAVTWALDHALRTHDPVHFVHIGVDDTADGGALLRAGETLLQHALDEAAEVPGVRATAKQVTDVGARIGPALVDASDGAALLVVGARGHGRLAGTLMGSISQYVTRHAPCPVLVARATVDPRDARVVAGVDDSPAADAVLRHSLEFAHVHGLPLTVIHTWRPSIEHPVGGMPSGHGDVGRRLNEETQVLAHRLDEWGAKFPEVEVSPEVIPGGAAPVLAAASQHARLVVIGADGGPAHWLRPGSVGPVVLRDAGCPVLVAR